MGAQLTFLGATGTVTGSRFLLEIRGRKYLIDCGLFQGPRAIKEKNWASFPIPPRSLDAVILTHGHIDHVGYLPKLVAEGFAGPVYATRATCALLKLLLPDAAYLQEQEAAYANKKGFSRHRPALPLFTARDAEHALERLQPQPLEQPLELDGLSLTFKPAGHILGSSFVQVQLDGARGRKITFSGDLGRYDGRFMKPPDRPAPTDIMLLESTYGGRYHSDDKVDETLAQLIQAIVERSGVLLIPSFAIGRTQQVLYRIRRLQDRGAAPDVPVYIDSPMAVDASHIYCRFGDDHNLKPSLLMDPHACPLRCRETFFINSVADSKALNTLPGPAIILSASGMCTGGRILHHLKWRLPQENNVVLFVGYQAQGTRGRALVEGAASVRIHGERFPVRAQIVRLDALSAHADQGEIARWLGQFDPPPAEVYLIHGEPRATLALQAHLKQELGLRATIPVEGDRIAIA
jgi:metallo-beta-lactamase family protein